MMIIKTGNSYVANNIGLTTVMPGHQGSVDPEFKFDCETELF